ncbi:MAG: hypothetical protein A2W22_05155 [Candidatus Levybacteria bacterium RBG_16_35_11]|nr:MAG: hypothetical protein A2W22_05155 [Candidatus Levybacteria bacterium RBG_16_35_11]
MKQTIKLGGLNCSACQKIIQKKISQLAEVMDVKVESNGTTEIKSSRILSENDLKKALEGTEYKILEI